MEENHQTEASKVPLQGQEEDDEKGEDYNGRDWKCGWFSWRPDCLQRCADMRAFTVCLSLLNLFGSINYSYYTAVITQIEKAFGLSSSMTGFIKNIDNIGYVCTVLFVGHFCRYANKPRLFAIASLLSASAIFLFAVPHFVFGGQTDRVYNFNISTESVNSSSSYSNQLSLCEDKLEPEESEKCGRRVALRAFNTGAFAIFIISELFQGMATSPKSTLTLTYMDDNAKKNSPKHFGVLFGLRSFAPVLGFVIGAWATTLYVDLTDTNLTPRDPRWVGAWWIGFVICAGCTALWALPLSLFPPKLKGDQQSQGQQDTPTESKRSHSLAGQFKDLPLALKRLLKNRLYVSLVVAACSEMYLIGYFTFVPKYIERQFHLSAAIASIITGTVGCIAWSIGPIISGQIVARINLTPRKNMAIIFIISGISIFGYLISMFLQCPQPEWAGTLTVDAVNLTQACNGNCTCDDLDFNPVCGSDGLQYFSPCHAGCTSQYFDATTKTTYYHGCQCIPDGEAKNGMCPSDCKMFIPYAVVKFLSSITFSMYIIPLMTVYLRCVHSKDKAISLAGGSFVTQIITFPAPLVFGYVIDTTCITQQSSCTRKGACLLYDLDLFRYRLHGTAICFKLVGLLCYGCAFYQTFTKQYSSWPDKEFNKLDSPLEQNGQTKNEKSDALLSKTDRESNV